MNGNRDYNVNFDVDGMTPLQLGKFSEHLAKVLFIKEGFEVYSTEVDERGIDVVVRRPNGPFKRIQIKSVCKTNYAYMTESGFDKFDPNLFCLLMVFHRSIPSECFLIPATAWQHPSAILKERQYNKKEFGINVSSRNLNLLREFTFDESVKRI
jgi:hypothetical protein